MSYRKYENLKSNFPVQFDSNESLDSINIKCKQLELDNWRLCEGHRKLPENMIDIYDMIGKNEKVYYKYLMDAFMNVFIKKQISYKGNSCEIQYSFCELNIDESIRDGEESISKQLFCMAYELYQRLPSKLKKE